MFFSCLHISRTRRTVETVFNTVSLMVLFAISTAFLASCAAPRELTVEQTTDSISNKSLRYNESRQSDSVFNKFIRTNMFHGCRVVCIAMQPAGGSLNLQTGEVNNAAEVFVLEEVATADSISGMQTSIATRDSVSVAASQSDSLNARLVSRDEPAKNLTTEPRKSKFSLFCKIFSAGLLFGVFLVLFWKFGWRIVKAYFHLG